jgi:glycosyltransferase involved in cell wall biosynthesis
LSGPEITQQLERRHEVRLLGPGAKEIEDAAGNRPDTTKQQSWGRQMRVILGAEHPDLLILFAGKSLFELVAWWWIARRAGFAGLRLVVTQAPISPWRSHCSVSALDAGCIDGLLTPQWSLAPHRRVGVGLTPLDQVLFLEDLVTNDRKSVLWVDPNISVQSPSMRSLVASAGRLQKAGWTLRLWCHETELEHMEVSRFWAPPIPSSLRLPLFFVQCNLAYLWRHWLSGKRPARLIHTTCANLLAADIVSVHFCVPQWRQISRDLGTGSWKERFSRAILLLSQQFERRQLRSRRLRLPVSRGIAGAIEAWHQGKAAVRILPNAFDQHRFNPEIRRRYRETIRQELRFNHRHVVFAFTSQGHYERKGFWLIINALTLLGDADLERVRLLIIGGTAPQLAQIQAQLSTLFPRWPGTLRFVGAQSAVERFLAAADAFVLPSYFEAFSLAEIEAAAMGLPLFVTNHFGVEMVLKEGVNGRLLLSEPADIAQKLEDFLRQPFRPDPPDVGEALNLDQFGDTVLGIYEEWSNGVVE